MSSQKTEHYQLHKWEPGDDFLREEFNENFEKLDGAARVVTGTYTGDGNSSQLIHLGFQPQAVLVIDQSGEICNGYNSYGGLALLETPMRLNSSLVSVTVEPTGFRVYYIYNSGTPWTVYTNKSNNIFHYLAFY